MVVKCQMWQKQFKFENDSYNIVVICNTYIHSCSQWTNNWPKQ